MRVLKHSRLSEEGNFNKFLFSWVLNKLKISWHCDRQDRDILAEKREKDKGLDRVEGRSGQKTELNYRDAEEDPMLIINMNKDMGRKMMGKRTNNKSNFPWNDLIIFDVLLKWIVDDDAIYKIQIKFSGFILSFIIICLSHQPLLNYCMAPWSVTLQP